MFLKYILFVLMCKTKKRADIFPYVVKNHPHKVVIAPAVKVVSQIEDGFTFIILYAQLNGIIINLFEESTK